MHILSYKRRVAYPLDTHRTAKCRVQEIPSKHHCHYWCLKTEKPWLPTSLPSKRAWPKERSFLAIPGMNSHLFWLFQSQVAYINLRFQDLKDYNHYMTWPVLEHVRTKPSSSLASLAPRGKAQLLDDRGFIGGSGNWMRWIARKHDDMQELRNMYIQ